MAFKLTGKFILITGAALGMGRLYALQAAKEKADIIVLWDINSDALEKTAEEVRASGSKVYTQQVNVAELAQIRQAASELRRLESNRKLDVLINNAGVVSGNNFFWNLDELKDTKFCIDINTMAPMYITREFIEDMLADHFRPKRILNIASAAALVSNPNMSVYVASKWACLGWSDSLRLELKKAKHKHIKVSTFCPSYVSTGMFEGAKAMFLVPILTPERAVKAAIKGMKKGKPIIYKPFTTRLSVLLKGILPIKLWDWVAQHIIHVYSSMDNFKGRK